jgi:hypothetical protein
LGKQYIASYDFGTSGVKAVLVGVDGRVASHATSNYPLLTPKVGWAEQEPEKYWEAVCKATGEAVRKAEIDPADVIELPPLLLKLLRICSRCNFFIKETGLNFKIHVFIGTGKHRNRGVRLYALDKNITVYIVIHIVRKLLRFLMK